jgi:hypothetical protein
VDGHVGEPMAKPADSHAVGLPRPGGHVDARGSPTLGCLPRASARRPACAGVLPDLGHHAASSPAIHCCRASASARHSERPRVGGPRSASRHRDDSITRYGDGLVGRWKAGLAAGPPIGVRWRVWNQGGRAGSAQGTQPRPRGGEVSRRGFKRYQYCPLPKRTPFLGGPFPGRTATPPGAARAC